MCGIRRTDTFASTQVSEQSGGGECVVRVILNQTVLSKWIAFSFFFRNALYSSPFSASIHTSAYNELLNVSRPLSLCVLFDGVVMSL